MTIGNHRFLIRGLSTVTNDNVSLLKGTKGQAGFLSEQRKVLEY